MKKTKIRIISCKYTANDVRKILAENPKAVLKAIVTLYNLQDDDEKLCKLSKHNNAKGFNSFDAEFMSDCALDIINTKKLSNEKYDTARTKIFKYANQLSNIANAKSDIQIRWDV